MSSVTIKMPHTYPLLQRALADSDESVAILAAVCSHADQAFTGWMLAQALAQPKRTHLIVCDNVAAVKSRIARWCGEDISADNIIVHSGHSLDAAPVDVIRDCVVLDCEKIPDPTTWLAMHVRGKLRFVGCATPRGHWWSNPPKSHRITGDDARAAGAVPSIALDRARRALPPAAYRARYDLEVDTASTKRVRINTFTRTRLQIRTKAGDVIPFRMNSVQHTYAAIKTVKRKQLLKAGWPLLFMLLKYRRGGFSTYEQAESYELVTSKANQQATTLAHTNEATSQIFRIAKLYHEHDPKAPAIKGVGNARKLEFRDLNSQFFIGTAGSSGFSRGDTLQRVHGSEVSKWGKGPRQHEQVRDLVAGLTEAASHGEVVLETTPNGIDWFHDTWVDAKQGKNLWTPVFIPWFWDRSNRMTEGTYSRDELLSTLNDKEKFLLSQHNVTLAQIAWRRMKMKSVGPLFIQEYPEDDISCFLTLGKCYFDLSRILDLLETMTEPERVEIPSGKYVEFEPPIPGEEYAAGTDTSEGVAGSDPNGTCMIKKRTGEVVADLHGIFTPRELAKLSKVMCERYNMALLGVERNNHGHAVLDRLTDGGQDHYQNLYYFDDEKPGWPTTPVTRPIMLADLREAIDEGYIKPNDPELLRECRLFVKQHSGKYEGSPDDRVMKTAIAWQMRQVVPRRSGIILVNAPGGIT